MSAAGSALLDTSVVIAHLRGDTNVTARFTEANVLYLPWIVLGELRYGAQRSKTPEKSLLEITDFQSITVLLFPDEQTVQTYSIVKAELIGAGKTIPENDVWIAALARQYGLPLVTRDQHFAFVEGLGTIAW